VQHNTLGPQANTIRNILNFTNKYVGNYSQLVLWDTIYEFQINQLKFKIIIRQVNF